MMMVHQLTIIFLASFALLVNGTAVERRDIFSDITAGAASLAGDATSVFGDATSIAAGVFETVTSDAGSVFTIVTSKGGSAITLAESAAKSAATEVTSFAGKEFTILSNDVVGTASPSATNNAAFSTVHSTGFAPLAASLATVLGGALVGAMFVL